MIVAGVRASLLERFPRGTQLLIASFDPREFETLAAELADPAIIVTQLSAQETPRRPGLAAAPHLLLDGLDELEDPVALLAMLHAAAPAARLFALVSNAAHVRGLAAFVSGEPPASPHPWVREELDALFSSGGWRPLAIAPVHDPALAIPAAFPADIAAGALAYRVDDRAAFERARTAAFIVVADRQ